MTLTQLFTAIANAIRAKTGSSDTIAAEDFPDEISTIETGKLTQEEYNTADDDLDDILENAQLPSGTININENGTVDVTNYATANVNVEFTVYELPDHIKFGGSKVFPSDFNTTNMTDFYYFLSSCDLKTLHQINTENVTNMERAFNDCVNLEDFPVLDGSKVTNFRNTFSNCNKLTNDSLNNILEMLKNATVYNASNNTKTLKWIGLSSTQATTCTTLSNWAACEAAGWTTGY